MRQRGALGRALSRAAAARHALPASRLRLRTHRWWSALQDGVPLHYLRAPRASAAARIDGRLTVRVLLAEARAARAASVHAWLVCMTAAREFVNRMGRVAERGVAARGVPALRWPVAGIAAETALLRGQRGAAGTDGRAAREALQSLNRDAPGRVLLRLLRSPGREAARERMTRLRDVQRFEATRVLRTLASSRVLASTQAFFRELVSRYLPSAGAARAAAVAQGEPAPGAAPAAQLSTPAGVRTVFEPLRLAYLSMAEAAREPFASVAAAPRSEAPRPRAALLRHRLYLLATRGQERMHGPARRTRPVPRASIGVAAKAPGTGQASVSIAQATNHLSIHQHSHPLAASAMASAIMRLRTPPGIAAAASTPGPMPRGYAAPAAALALRRTPRAAPADHRRDARQLQQQVARQVTQELAQNAPWRGQLEQAVLAPRVLRELADRVAGAIAGRQGLERYRRGL